MHGKLGVLSQMCYDHSADRVRIEHASVEDEGYKVVVQNNGLKIEVRGDKS